MMTTPRTAWIDGSFLPLAEAKVSVLDRGFLFADSVYEVTAVLAGRLVDSGAHLARLARSAAELGIPLPAIDIAAVERELILRDGIEEGVVYLQLTRGAEDRDFLPSPDLTPTLVMFAQAKTIRDTPAARNGIAVATLPDQRWARRDIKSTGLLAQSLAKQAARAAGAQEAWLVEDGFVTEGASSTAFIVAGNTLVTRPNSTAILPGVTRAAIEALATETGLAIDHRAFTVDEALAADEAFITSASTFVLPVVRIDGQAIGGGVPGPVAIRLRALYLDAAAAATAA